MFKILLVAGTIIGGLILGDVVEVSVHRERLGGLPARLSAHVSDAGTWEQMRALGIDLKRRGEQALASDERRKMELALLYVKTDAERLAALIEKKGEADAIAPQAKLLVKSLERARQAGGTVAIDVVADVRDQSREAFGLARASLEHLQTLGEEYASAREQLRAVAAALTEQLQGVELADQVPGGEVAGTSRAASPAPSPAPGDSVAIPLNF